MKATFSQRIKNLRTAKHLTKTQLAEKLWVTRNTVDCWEKGTAAPDSMDVIEMSRIFGVAASDIIGDDMESFSKLPVLNDHYAEVPAIRRNKSMLFAGSCWTVAAVCNFLAVVIGKNPAMLGSFSIDVLLASKAFKKYIEEYEIEN